ncbi:5034_t:CDS:1, partial [Gigaspora margarita]
ELSDEESFRDDNYSSDSSDDTNAQQSTVQKQRFQTLTNCKRPCSNKKIILNVRKAIYNSLEHY